VQPFRVKKIIASKRGSFEDLLALVQKRKRANRPKSNRKKPWLKHSGWAKDDPIYEKAMKIGAAYREAS
jgi:hypothetical protein